MALAALFLPPSHAAFLPPSSPFRSPKKLPAALFPSLLGQRTNAVVLLRSGGGPPPPPPLSSDRRPTTDRPRGRALRRQGGREHLIDVPGLLVHSHRVRLGKWGEGGGGEQARVPRVRAAAAAFVEWGTLLFSDGPQSVYAVGGLGRGEGGTEGGGRTDDRCFCWRGVEWRWRRWGTQRPQSSLLLLLFALGGRGRRRFLPRHNAHSSFQLTRT